MSRRFSLFLGVLLAFCLAPLYGAEYPDVLKELAGKGTFEPLFPFQIEPNIPDNITNVQTWSGPWSAAGSNGPLGIADGRFVGKDGKPCRFLGTNICFSGCFPKHEDAETVAKTLARFGINLVRLHYVHHKFPPNRKYASPDSFIEPVQLERFDYFVAELKKNGVFVDLALNIARKFGAVSGFENADSLPWYNNGLDNFEPRMIRLQKKYLTDFMTHVNPYTGLAYKDDPGIAVVEIANENSVVASYFKRTLDTLAEPYSTEFRTRWNDWLVRKYKTTEAVKAAWKYDEKKLGMESIADGTALPPAIRTKTDSVWGFQGDAQSEAAWSIEKEANGNFVRLAVRKIGLSPNIPQFYRSRLAVRENVYYTVAFKLRSPDVRNVSVRMSQNHKPWSVTGLRTTFDVGPEWREYSIGFRATMTDDDVRLVFANFQPGTVDIAGVSYRTGCVLPKDESLANKSFAVPSFASFGSLPERDRDVCAFLHELEDDYFSTMYAHLKNEIRCIQPISGTQLRYGYNDIQYKMDYCDIHGYWVHPSFPHTKWDQRDWFIRNIALVNSGVSSHILETLGMARLVGRPLNVSEYDHAYPNLYCAEGNVQLAAFGAFQDWDAVMQFAWTHSDNYIRKIMSPMFDMCSNQSKLAHLPACYAMFVRGDVRRGPGQYIYAPKTTRENEINMRTKKELRWHDVFTDAPCDPTLTQAVYSGIDPAPSDKSPFPDKTRVTSWKELPEALGSPEKKWVWNEFRQIYRDQQLDGAGYFLVDTAGTKALTGFVRGRSFKFDGMTLVPGKTRLDWLTFTMTRTGGKSENDPAARNGGKPVHGKMPDGNWLLAVTGLIQNTGMVIRDLGTLDKISVAQDQGGTIGVAPILCEGVPASVTLAGRTAGEVAVYALDSSGNRAGSVAVRGLGNDVVFELEPKYRTIWYEVVIRTE